MDQRVLGRTGLRVSALGLGGGAVGGLMVRGEPADQERGLAAALDAGITFIDTAPSYGDGASETNLGRALARVAAAASDDIVLATKFTISEAHAGRVAAAIAESLEQSLRRLGRERVDVLQLHNAIGAEVATPGRSLPAIVVTDEVAPGLERLREAGKIGWWGITAVGEPDALAAVLDSRAFHTAQVPFNLLTPGASEVLAHASAAEMGTIGIRALAGGALSGTTWRHPIGMPEVAPIASGESYEADVAAALRYVGLVDGGWAGSLAEAALRYALSEPRLSTVLIGVSTIEQLQDAITAAERGPLPAEALAHIEAVRRATG
jgi:L-galactose dehydrogenase/L-glyceraldehyde 3-phosphate reductase